MQFISTVEELIESFENAEPSEHIKVLKSIDIPVSEFERFATWKDGGYTRNCLARREEFEFILLCWDKDACTPIHGHAGENCWVYQVDGTVQEQRLVEVEKGFKVTHDSKLSKGALTYMHDRMGYHTIKNISGTRAMTLHVYAKPIDSCKVYCEEKDCFEIKEMQYDTIEGNEVRFTGS